MNDRSTEALLARRALAEMATAGMWDVVENLGDQTQCSVRIINSKHHIVLRDDWITFTDALFIVRHSPDVVMADIDEILRLRAEVARLEKEGDWLAARCREFCDSNNYCNECALYPGDADFPHPDCGQKIDVENARWRFEKHVVSDWREAARKAVEEA